MPDLAQAVPEELLARLVLRDRGWFVRAGQSHRWVVSRTNGHRANESRLPRRRLRGMGSAAGHEDGPGRPGGRPGEDPRRGDPPHGGGPNRRRSARLGPGGELQRRRRPPRGARAGRSTRSQVPTLPCWPRNRPPTASTPAATPARGPTATACSPAGLTSPSRPAVSLFWPHRVDRGALAGCAEALRGTHDFTAFTPTQTEHVRFERDIMRADWREKPAVLGEGTVLELWIEADAFMRSMSGCWWGRCSRWREGGAPWRTSSPCSKERRASGPETPRARMVSTWPASAMGA